MATNAQARTDDNGNYAVYCDSTNNATTVKLDANNNLPVARMTAGGLAPGQTLKTFNSSGGVSINAGATVALYTVTTGKTLLISDLEISTDSTIPVLWQLKAGAVVIQEGFITNTAPLSAIGIETQDAVAGGVALSLVFGTSAGKNATYKLRGFEQ